jgi:hypothetical protein
MIVECPSCGAKNKLSDVFRAGRIYRCGSCKSAIERRSDTPEVQDTLYAADDTPGPELWERTSHEPDIAQEVAAVEEIPFSVKRLFVAALFGALIAGYAMNASDETMLRIVSMVQGTDEASAAHQYASSSVFPFLTFAFGAALGSGVAAFLARRRAVLAGLLAGSPFALTLLTFSVLSVVRGAGKPVSNISYQLYEFLLSATVVLASVAGALMGQQNYSPALDRDLSQTKVTIFGVSWGHYFWIFPLVLYPYLDSLVMAIYAGVLAFLSSFYVAVHPSLWFSFGWDASFALNPMAVYGSFWLLLQGSERFLDVMGRRPGSVRKLTKFWNVILYGLLAPGLAFAVSAISANFTHALPKPTPGDWKIGLAISGGFAVLSLGERALAWIVKRMRARSGESREK